MVKRKSCLTNYLPFKTIATFKRDSVWMLCVHEAPGLEVIHLIYNKQNIFTLYRRQ